MRLLLATLVAALALPGSVPAGGRSITGFVLLPAQSRLAVVDIDARRVSRTIAVRGGPGPVAASIDGSRVLVANTRVGTVTQLDGLTNRRLRTFRGLGHPVALVLLPRTQIGLVRPRYAVVADARGWIDVLDLDIGRIVRRIPVAHSHALALSDPQLWVSSAGGTTLTQLDVSTPARAHITARARTTVVPAALAPDPSGIAVDVVSRGGTLVRVEAVSLAHSVVAHLGDSVTQLLIGYRGFVWATKADGRVLGVRARDGRVVFVSHVLPHSRFEIVAGWLASAHGDALRMSVLGRHKQPTTISLPGRAGAFSFAVI